MVGAIWPLSVGANQCWVPVGWVPIWETAAGGTIATLVRNQGRLQWCPIARKGLESMQYDMKCVILSSMLTLRIVCCSVTCVFLACKVEEFNVSIYQFVANIKGILHNLNRIFLQFKFVPTFIFMVCRWNCTPYIFLFVSIHFVAHTWALFSVRPHKICVINLGDVNRIEYPSTTEIALWSEQQL